MTDNPTPNSTALQSALSKKMTEIEERSDEQNARDTAQKTGFPYIDLQAFPLDNTALFMVEEKESRSAGAAMIARKGLALSLAVIDPNNPEVQKIISDSSQKGFAVQVFIASRHRISLAWQRYATHKSTMQAPAGVINLDEVADLEQQIKSLGDLKGRISSLPVTQVLDIMIAGALKIGASDIHFEPEEKTVRLRYRLDGMLTDVLNLAPAGYSHVLSRIKLTAGLKINVHLAPQDGRITIRKKDKDIELRVSILPGAYGENIVMRILDPSSIRQELEQLGMREDTLTQIKQILQKNAGAILTTGPTGSGKTTTLYAFVQFINTPDIKVITLEDPIEYHVHGISQTQVNDEAGYTFAGGLRSIVRQDPDVILVGEIRDKETGEIAMQAALTGHLVLSTIHTNSAAGTIPRLVDLGVKAVTIAPAMIAAMAQRLVRRLCQKCKQKEKIHDGDRELMEKYLKGLREIPNEIFYPAKAGCDGCSNLGYKGRIGVYEVFPVDTEMQKLISKNPVLTDIQELAVKQGMTTLLQDAFIKITEGHTSVEEVMRVIGE